VLIHFPIALFIIGVLFDFLSQWKNQRLLAAAAYYNLLVAAIATYLVSHRNSRVAVGAGGAKTEKASFDASGAGCVSTVLIWVVWSIHTKTRRKQQAVCRIPLADRGCGRSDRRTDRTPRRVSQWSEWTGIGVFLNS